MLEIKTGQMVETKKVLIDGHPYTVRRFGAGERLALLQRQKRLNFLASLKKPTDEQIDEGNEINRSLLEDYIRVFDDGEGGERSRLLIESLEWGAITKLFTQIWDAPASQSNKVPKDGGEES